MTDDPLVLREVIMDLLAAIERDAFDGENSRESTKELLLRAYAAVEKR